MKATDIPSSKFPLAFAASGSKQTIPEASQIGITDGRASLTDGFPPLTRTPIAAGGVPPFGTDMNGILYMISAWTRWFNAGGQVKFDSSFSTDTNVNGYPAGAVVARSDGAGFWLNLTDDNTTNPDAVGATNWAPLDAYGIAAVTGLTTGTVTLTPTQYGLPIITLAGTLTGNVQLVFPATKNQWLVVNNTTGNFSVTAKTAAGSGVIVTQGLGANVYGDGTNIVAPTLQTPVATISAQPAQFGQIVGIVGMSRNASMNIATAGVSGTFTADELIVETALGGLRYCLSNVSDTFNLTTDMDTGSAPASGYVALYKLFNPATGATARRIVNVTSITAPEVFSGANPPAGFIASALCGVHGTNPSGQFVPCALSGRTVSIPPTSGLSTTGSSPAFSSFSLAAAVPKNAKSIKFETSVAGSSASVLLTAAIAGSAAGLSQASISSTNAGAGSGLSGNGSITLTTPQTAYVKIPLPSSGTQTTAMAVNEYTF